MTRDLIGLMLVLSLCACDVLSPPPAHGPRRDDEAAASPPALDAAPEEGILAVMVPRIAADLSSRVDGKLVEIAVPIGGRVEAGEVVARLDNPELAHGLRISETSVRSARSQLEQRASERDAARRKLRQVRELGAYAADDERLEAADQTTRAGQRVAGSRAEVARQRAESDRLRSQIDALEVRADFAGLVAAHYESPGQHLTSGQPILRLVSLEAVVRFAVPSAEANRFLPGTRVVFEPADDSMPVEVVVSACSPEVDLAGMVLVEADLEAPTTLRPGISGRVR